MEIIIGKYSGFCSGVSVTYNKAKEEVLKNKIYCLGPIIHNNEVIKELESLGMTFVDSIKDVPNGSRLIFRAHGEPLDSYEYAKNHNIELIDLTCGRVKDIHDKVLKERDDSFIIIVGKRIHPEVIGTKGFCKDNSFVIETKENIKDCYKEFLNSGKRKIYVVSQTTFRSILFDELVDEIKEVFKNIPIKVDKTICNATEKRQKEVYELSKKCTKILVVGSKNSSNTIELYKIAKSNLFDTYFVETVADLSEIKFKENDVIAVVAGASVPTYQIDSIVNKLTKGKIKERNRNDIHR